MDFVESISSEPEETRTVDVTSEAAAEGSQESQGFTFNESSLGSVPAGGVDAHHPPQRQRQRQRRRQSGKRYVC